MLNLDVLLVCAGGLSYHSICLHKNSLLFGSQLLGVGSCHVQRWFTSVSPEKFLNEDGIS